jgi:hypothetical protein
MLASEDVILVLTLRIQDGTIAAAGSAAVDATGAVVTNVIKPAPGSSKVTVESALLVDSVVSGGELKAVKSVETVKLSVTNDVSIGGNTHIEGNLNVQGSVVGSRPYMDSSDARLKKDVEPIKNALQKLMQLDGVSCFSTSTGRENNLLSCSVCNIGDILLRHRAIP